MGEVSVKGFSKKNLELLRKSANGNVEAQYELGLNYLEGNGVPENHKLAIEWLTKSSDKGFEDAQYLLGRCYENGTGVPRNLTQALLLYEKAAKAANKYAQFALGEYFVYTNDFDKATEWFKRAARQQYPPAQCELARCYFYGLGKIRDVDMARDLLEKAVSRNYEPAKELLGKM